MDDKLLTPAEAQQYLRIEAKSTFNRLCALRVIPVTKVGKFNRFRRSLLDKYLEENTIWNHAQGRKRKFNLIEGEGK